MGKRFTTGDKLILLRESGNIEYTIGQFYFAIGDCGSWVAGVDMTGPHGTAQFQSVEMIRESLAMPIMCPPESVEFCEELLRIRKSKES